MDDDQGPKYVSEDQILNVLLSLANKVDGFSFDITVHVSGTWLTGTVVSETEYILAFANMVANKLSFAPDADENDVRNARLNLNENLATLSETQNVKVTHMHLKSPAFFYPVEARMVSDDFPYCRILLADITAWIMGKAS